MNWNFSAWAIRNPIFPVLLFVVLMVLGWFSFQSLPITRFPNIDVPFISVVVTDTGVAPAEMETQTTKKIEDAVAGISGVKHIMSTISDGASTTLVEFRLEVPSSKALDDVRDAIAKIRSDLPQTVDEPIVQRIDVESMSIVTYAAASPTKTPEELSWFVDDVVVRALQSLKGVGRVERMGGVAREIRVALDPDRLMALGITAADVNRQLKTTNIDLSGGKAKVGGQEQAIRTLASAGSLEALKATKITLPGGRDVRLSDLGTIEDTVEEARSFARLDGKPIVAFSIYRAKGASDADVGTIAAAKIAELGAAYPDVTFSMVDDQVEYTYGNFESAMHTLMEGAALAVLVVFLFLRDWRATLIAAVAMPLAAIPTFFVMSLMGFSLNLVSLLAITLVTGILVDDAIVEIENIIRHIRMGKKPYRAAMEAADEIGLAVIAITMTIIAVFAPVSFMGGIAGQYFKQFGLTVAVAVFFSLLVARLITPMMAAFFLRPHGHEAEHDGFVMRAYTRLLRVTLRHRWITMILGVVLFVGSMMTTQLLPTGFMPAEDTSRIVTSVELPPGAQLDETQHTTDAIVKRLQALPEVESVFVIGGSSPTGTLELRRATVITHLVPKADRTRTQQEVQAAFVEVLAGIPDARFFALNDNGERAFSVGLLGKDGDVLKHTAAKLTTEMRDEPVFLNPSSSASLDRPEIRIVPDLDKAADLGVSTAAISETVRVATIGDVGPNLSKLTVDNRQVPIRVELDDHARADLSVIQSMRVQTGSGQTVPLSAVAAIGFGQGPSSIDRYDRERRVSLGADMAPGKEIGEGVERLKALPTAKALPEGVKLQDSGDVEIMNEVFSGFATAMGAGIMMVFVVLILLFGSVFQPLTILATLPLSVGGVVLALLLTQNAVSMPVVIGILMLMGIVTKNAIMLVDFAVEEEKRGTPQREAIIEAGRKRARPIVMTTIAMVAGMVPAALALGAGGEFRAPMAIAVMGGLVVSTALSLVFIPSVYTIMDDLSRLTSRLFRRLFKPNAPEEAEPARHGRQVAVPAPRDDLGIAAE